MTSSPDYYAIVGGKGKGMVNEYSLGCYINNQLIGF